jgi:hypothetical protein
MPACANPNEKPCCAVSDRACVDTVNDNKYRKSQFESNLAVEACVDALSRNVTPTRSVTVKPQVSVLIHLYRKYIASISQVYRNYIASISQVYRNYIASISQVYRNYIASISQL